MGQVIQTNSSYKIKTYDGSIPANSITFDTAEVHIIGDLVVDGTQTTVNVSDLAITDNIIKLNQGETGNGVTLQYSGIAVDRGYSDSPTNTIANYQATLWFNELNHAWEILDQGGVTKKFDESSLKLRKIITDSATDSGDLTLIGTGTGVVKVAGTSNYEAQVLDDDDIPNKRYVDLSIKNKQPDNRIQRDDTYVITQDLDGGASAVAIMTAKGVTITIGSGGGGANYNPGDIVTFSGGVPLRPTVVQVDTIGPLGDVTGISVLDVGEYSTLPPSNTNIQSTVDRGIGTGASFFTEWEVARVEIINGGNDYVSADVTFLPSGSFAASGTVTVDSNPLSPTYQQITNVAVTVQGTYTTSIPSVVFSATGVSLLTESQVNVVVDNQTSAIFFNDRVDIGQLEISQNSISTSIPYAGNNIVLDTSSGGRVEVGYALQLNETGTAISAVSSSSLLYGNTPAEGQSGLYFNNTTQETFWTEWVTNNNTYSPSNISLNPVRNELISKHKALVMSMLF